MSLLSSRNRVFMVLVLMVVLYCAITTAIPTSNAQPAFIKQLIKEISNSKKSLDGDNIDYNDDGYGEFTGYGYPGRMGYFIPMNLY